MLCGFLFFGLDSLAQRNSFYGSDAVFFNASLRNDSGFLASEDLFFSQNGAGHIETPDLKLIQDYFVYGITTPHVLTTQTLGAIMGGPDQGQDRKDVIDYVVQSADTLESVAANFGISLDTLRWANDLSKKAKLAVGQNLVILPVSGVTYLVKSGDTLDAVSKTYKAKIDDIISFNNLKDAQDIFIGDILIIPGGLMPQKTLPSVNVTPLADSFFIYPAEGIITQGLHYFNAVDLANKCDTPIYAAAAGIVQRAVGNGQWNFGMGNYITILHSSGVSTYYGHLMTLFVKPGDTVNVGDRIGLMGRTGDATGCHVHFQVMGAKNPLVRYLVGSTLRYK